MTSPTPITAEEFIARQQIRWAVNPWVKAKDIRRNGWHWMKREATTFWIQSDSPNKVLVVERLAYDRFEPKTLDAIPSYAYEPGRVEYRICYFIVAPSRGAWWFGQYAPMIPAEDFAGLMKRAHDEGTILSDLPSG